MVTARNPGGWRSTCAPSKQSWNARISVTSTPPGPGLLESNTTALGPGYRGAGVKSPMGSRGSKASSGTNSRPRLGILLYSYAIMESEWHASQEGAAGADRWAAEEGIVRSNLRVATVYECLTMSARIIADGNRSSRVTRSSAFVLRLVLTSQRDASQTSAKSAVVSLRRPQEGSEPLAANVSRIFIFDLLGDP